MPDPRCPTLPTITPYLPLSSIFQSRLRHPGGQILSTRPSRVLRGLFGRHHQSICTLNSLPFLWIPSFSPPRPRPSLLKSFRRAAVCCQYPSDEKVSGSSHTCWGDEILSVYGKRYLVVVSARQNGPFLNGDEERYSK